MVHVHVLYPNGPDATFDHEYYATKHAELVRRLLGPMGLHRVVLEKGLGGGAPQSPPPFIGKAMLVFESLEALGAALAKHGAELMADIPNYTNTKPTILITEVTCDLTA